MGEMPRPTPPKYRTTNWPEYNAALRRRGSLDVWFALGIDWFAAPDGRPGRWLRFLDPTMAARSEGELILITVDKSAMLPGSTWEPVHDQCRSGTAARRLRIKPGRDRPLQFQERSVEGVRLIQEREMRLAALHASINRGLADAEAGRTVPAEEAFDRLEAKYQAMARPAE